jgi:hypothetical protein
VQPAVAAVVRKLMAKMPEDRYQTPAEAAEALRHAVPATAGPPPVSQGTASALPRQPGPIGASTTLAPTEDFLDPERTKNAKTTTHVPAGRERRWARWQWLAACALGVTVVLVGWVVFLLSLGQSRQAGDKGGKGKPAEVKAGAADAPAPPEGDFKHAGAQMKGVMFDGLECYIKVTAKANVEGEYSRPGGVLRITVKDGSNLKIVGECKKVIIEELNNRSAVDLKRLKIGAGGVAITNMTMFAHLYTGECKGKIVIRSMAHISTLHYRRGTQIEGRENVTLNANLEEGD